jgi:type II secretory pathway component PulK
MGLIPALKKRKESESGVALFMVIASISVLAVLVTEFTFIAQVNQTIAYDGLDQLKAHYLAKSGFKLSLLRLKAYAQVKGVIKSMTGGQGAAPGGAGIPGVPKAIIEKIWSFPFFYPIPTNIPGLSMSEKDAITKFQKNSGLDGRFSAVIESESGKYNLNSILAGFSALAQPTPTATPTATPSPTAGASPTPTPTFDPEAAKQSLAQFIGQIIQNKSEQDSDFASEHRDFRLEDLMENISTWSDPTYERANLNNFQSVGTGVKRGPFFSVAELHMIPPIDDELFSLIAPALTVSATPGVNVNTIGEAALRGLIPQIKDEEVKEFYKFRDSEEEDNSFKNEDEFFKYLLQNVAAFANNQRVVDDFKDSLAKRHIRIVVDESEFKITVQAQVNNATRTLEAWVTLVGKGSGATGTNPNPAATPNPAVPPLSGPGLQGGAADSRDSGLRVTFMRFL